MEGEERAEDGHDQPGEDESGRRVDQDDRHPGERRSGHEAEFVDGRVEGVRPAGQLPCMRRVVGVLGVRQDDPSGTGERPDLRHREAGDGGERRLHDERHRRQGRGDEERDGRGVGERGRQDDRPVAAAVGEAAEERPAHGLPGPQHPGGDPGRADAVEFGQHQEGGDGADRGGQARREGDPGQSGARDPGDCRKTGER
nr:hypothetical protein [Streptomyces sp. Termitarium-T10T-6]